MKKLLAFLLTAVMVFSLCSCGEEKEPNLNPASVTVVVATEPLAVYEVSLEGVTLKNGLFDVFEKGEISYEESGGFLSSVGALKQNTETGEYIYIYTSNEKDFDVSEYKNEVEYEGKTLVSTGVGARDMTLTDGTVIYITLIKF